MRPVLEDRVPAGGELVERRPRIVPEPAERRQVVRPGQDVHRVDLHDGQPLGHPPQLPGADGAGRARLGEPLGGQRDAPGQPGGQPFGGGGLTAADPARPVRRSSSRAARLRCPGEPRGAVPPRSPARADVSVRPARPEDAAEIARVQVVTWRTAYRALLPAAVLDDWDAEAATARLAGGGRGPADAGPRRAGGAGAEHRRRLRGLRPGRAGRRRGAATPPGPTAELSTLLVEPRWGRRGHGSRLLAAVADVARARWRRPPAGLAAGGRRRLGGVLRVGRLGARRLGPHAGHRRRDAAARGPLARPARSTRSPA